MAGQDGQAAERAQQNAQQQSAPQQQFATLQEFCALHELQLPPIECGGGVNCFYNCCAAAGAWHAWNEADAGTRDALQARVRQEILNWLNDNGPNRYITSSGLNLLNVLLQQGSTQFFQQLLRSEDAMRQLADYALQEDLRQGDLLGDVQGVAPGASYFELFLDSLQDEKRQEELTQLYKLLLPPLKRMLLPQRARTRHGAADAAAAQGTRMAMVRLMLGELPCCPSEAVGEAVWDLYLASIMRSGEYNEPPSLIAATGVLNRPITVVRVDGNDRMLGVPMEFDVVAPPGVGEQPAPVYLLLRSEHWQLLRAREKAPEDGQPAGVECNDLCDNDEELWPPAVMRDNTDALTAALKKHFGISGIYANFNDKRRPGITEWRINSSRVQRITRGGNHNRTIRGSTQIRDQPLLYTHWWLFWAAVHVHKKLFPEDFTEKRIMEKFEAALQEQAGAASPRQSESFTVDDYMSTKAAFDENPQWAADLDKVQFVAAERAPRSARDKKQKETDKQPAADPQQPAATDPELEKRQDKPYISSDSAPGSDGDDSDDEDWCNSSPVSSRCRVQQLQGTADAPAAGWPADDDFVDLPKPRAWQVSSSSAREGSRLGTGTTERFGEDQFRVSPKLAGGPDKLLDLIRGSLSGRAGVEAFRSDTRRAPHVPAAAVGAQRDDPADQQAYLCAARRHLAHIKEQLVTRLSCRQADHHPPVALRFLELPDAGGPPDHPLTSVTGLPGCSVVATQDIPAWTFLDLYVGRVTKASGSSSSRPSANYTVVWKHEEDCIVIDGTTAGNILADVNDTARLEVAVEEPTASSIISAACPTSSMSCTSQEIRGTLTVRPKGFKPDNVQLVSVRDASTGVVYVFFVSTRDIKKGEELLLDYDIGELSQLEWWQGPYLKPLQQLGISAEYKAAQDRRLLWDTVRATIAKVRALVAKLNDSALPPAAANDSHHPVIKRADVQTLHEMLKARLRLPSAVLRLEKLVNNRKSAAQRKSRQAPLDGGAGNKTSGGLPEPAQPPAAAVGNHDAGASVQGQPLVLGKRGASRDAEQTADSVLSDEIQDLLITIMESPLNLQYAARVSILVTDSMLARQQQAVQHRQLFFARLREYVPAGLAKLQVQPSEPEMKLVLEMIRRWLQLQA